MARPPPDPLYVLRPHGAEITSLSFVPVETPNFQDRVPRESLVSGDVGGDVSLWSLATRRVIVRWRAHDAGVLETAALPDNRLTSQGRDGFVRVWDLNRVGKGSRDGEDAEFGRCGCVFELRTGASTFCRAALATSCDPSAAPLLAAPSGDGSDIDIWDLRSGAVAQRLRSSEDEAGLGMLMGLRLACPTAAAGGAGAAPIVVAAYESGDVVVRDVRTGRLLSRARAQTEPLLCLELDAAASGGVCAGAGASLRFFSLDRLAPSLRIEADADDSGSSLPSVEGAGAECSAAGPARGSTLVEAARATGATGVAAAGTAGRVNTDVCVRLRHEVRLPSAGISDARIRGDGKLLATGGWDGAVRVFQWRNPAKKRPCKPLAVLRTHGAAVSALAWSADCRLLATGSRDKTIALWSLYPPLTA
jgi:WD40 repeat protein